MMVYICIKFHENILNGIRVVERTRKVNGQTDRQTDRRTDGGHDIIRPVFDGRIKLLPSDQNKLLSITDRSKAVLLLWFLNVTCFVHVYVYGLYSLGAESRKKSYAKHFGYKVATGLHLKKNEF